MTWPVLTILLLGIWHGINPGMGWLFAVALGMQERERRAVWKALLPLAAGHALAIASALAVAIVIGAVVPATILKWVVGMVLVAFGLTRITRARHPRYGGMRMSMRRLTVWSFLMASAHGAGLMVLPFVLAAGAGGTGIAAEPGVVEGPGEAGDQRRATNGGRQAGTPGDGRRATGGARRTTDTRRDTRLASLPTHVAGQAIGESGMSAHAADVRSAPGETSMAAHGTHAEHLAGLGDPGPTSGWIVLFVHTAGYLFATGLIAVLVYEKLGVRMLRTVWLNLDLIWGAALATTGVIAPFV